MAMIDSERLNLMTWNVKAGGFDGYGEDNDKPPRGAAIQDYIKKQTEVFRLDGTAVIDAERWSDVYGGDEGIAQHLGYKAARFAYLNDDRLKADGGAGIGVAFASNMPILYSAPLDLDTRQGLNVIVEKNNQDIQIASVYLDDLDANKRSRQVEAMLADLEPNMSTIVMGDMNSLRERIGHIERKFIIRDALFRAAARVAFDASRISYFQGGILQSVGEMPMLPVATQMRKAGFRDADPEGYPTAPLFLRSVGIDYVFMNDHLGTETVLVDKSVPSDHASVIASISHKNRLPRTNVIDLSERRRKL